MLSLDSLVVPYVRIQHSLRWLQIRLEELLSPRKQTMPKAVVAFDTCVVLKFIFRMKKQKNASADGNADIE